MNPVHQLEKSCNDMNGDFNSNPTGTKSTCKINNSKLTMNRGREETGLNLKQEKGNVEVTGRIQASNENIEIDTAKLGFGTEVLIAKNPDGESLEIKTRSD